MLRLALGAALTAAVFAHCAHAAVPPGPYDVATVYGNVYNPNSWKNDSYLREPANGLIECLPQPKPGLWSGPFPGMIFIHGGAWRANSMTQRLPECQLWASYGFVAITIQYRLTVVGNPQTYWPAQLLDAQAAVRWFKTNARSLNLNMCAIGAWGDSAGGQLADFLGWEPATVAFGGDPVADLNPV